MKLLPFVCGSSVLLAAWLLVTFVHDVPSQRYPKLQRPATASASEARNSIAATAETPTPPAEAELSAAVSR